MVHFINGVLLHKVFGKHQKQIIHRAVQITVLRTSDKIFALKTAIYTNVVQNM